MIQWVHQDYRSRLGFTARMGDVVEARRLAVREEADFSHSTGISTLDRASGELLVFKNVP